MYASHAAGTTSEMVAIMGSSSELRSEVGQVGVHTSH